jgi:hypothetical protein
MSIDIAVMRQIAEDLYIAMVERELGTAGVDALKSLLAAVHDLYRHVDPDSIAERILIFHCTGNSAHPLPTSDAITVRRRESIHQQTRGPIAIQVLPSGECLLWNEARVEPTDLSTVAVVYEYVAGAEYFYARSQKRKAPKIVHGYSSVFSVPTFSELRDALEAYKSKHARVSTCEILSTCWYDTNRLFFKSKPEFIMRKSLCQFLHSTLRAEVRPEQIVDETHPVDIKVTWNFTNRLALIEIKWLGESKNPAGEATTSYSAARAREGAQQLADYLEANRHRAPEHVSRGYLVVFDGRRRGMHDATLVIDRANGLHYATQEIPYNPEFHRTREDFEEPVRFFLEPKYS